MPRSAKICSLRIQLFWLVILVHGMIWLCPSIGQAFPQTPWEVGALKPLWSAAKVKRKIAFGFDQAKSMQQNGSRLIRAMTNLKPGDQLLIGPGKYVIGPKIILNLNGTAQAPIRIEAADPKRPPVLTRNANQNLLNFGEGGRCRFVIMRNLELVGGSIGIRFHDTSQFWLDQCHVHNAEHGGITANTADTSRLFITRNHIHDFHQGTAEGMYLGANHSKCIMRDSVIAKNHVHHCRGNQGDGIEVKQGSFNNWIVENHVHDTKYPCIIAYGTSGAGVNMIERNICYRSGDNVMQVQGEAIIRNNLIMSGRGAGFASTDHQGKTRNLTVVHNTIINNGVGANLTSWNGRDKMVFANNAVYSKSAPSIRFPSGAGSVKIVGNVVFGNAQGPKQGYVSGDGLSDFLEATWDAKKRNIAPSEDSKLIGAGASEFKLSNDIRNQARREKKVVVGAHGQEQ